MRRAECRCRRPRAAAIYSLIESAKLNGLSCRKLGSSINSCVSRTAPAGTPTPMKTIGIVEVALSKWVLELTVYLG
jgi:hypothetical protein